MPTSSPSRTSVVPDAVTHRSIPGSRTSTSWICFHFTVIVWTVGVRARPSSFLDEKLDELGCSQLPGLRSSRPTHEERALVCRDGPLLREREWWPSGHQLLEDGCPGGPHRAARVCIRDDGLERPQRLEVLAWAPRLGCEEKGRAERDARRAELEQLRDAAAVDDPSGRDDRHRHGL